MDRQTSPGPSQAVPTGSPHGFTSGPPPGAEDRTHASQETIKYYAAALSGLIALFIISHWFRLFARRHRLSSSWSSVILPIVSVTRTARRVLIRNTPGFTSVGHAVLVVVFVAINLVFSFTGYDWSSPTNFAVRFGWMAAANLTLVVFLSLKNTPLAILTSYSYERLNTLHQYAGIATVVYMILHATLYCSFFINRGLWNVLNQPLVTSGIVLGFAMFAAGVEALVLRRFQYELFYVIHVLLFLAVVVTLGFHQPDVNRERLAVIACIVAGIWALDRLIRLSRVLYNSVNNRATIHPLPNGGTRILLSKPLHSAVPGTHCYVWLPRIRLIESHPFTIVATSPTELIVNSFDGFTKDLHKYATKNPGATIKASLEGPYGTFPDPTDFDKVVLVAGGSGASFTFGLASNMLERMAENSDKQIDFIWAVKERDNLTWFNNHLNVIRAHTHAPRIALKLHATKPHPRQEDLSEKPSTQTLNSEREYISEKPSTRTLLRKMSQSSVDMTPATPVSPTDKEASLFISDTLPIVASEADPEKEDLKAVICQMNRETATTGVMELVVEQGRPDIAVLVKEAVNSVDKTKRVLIAACGPDSLMKVVRNTAAALITKDGPSVELHCEQFGW